ncbi:DNA repair protein RecN [Oceanicoccus sagamiensis]|uniref:DNA repair protein RecN n=1 Tax=Oceanicoccus sagamiensis TaxID=716816 RepID=A0A1X9N5A3_9GAMM|nr:DNA repair protein RecN [Oceanicoccus sagamiensis]ARN73290.1 DNA repair protein RecN [Oceanicoccus sagamiensis]
MLVDLSVNNFAIAAELEMEFNRGMTVITGETGAGKSIMLDALGLALGDRADAGVVRSGTERADIHALFDISAIKDAKQWLQEHDLLDGSDCLLRRVITKEGRSRGYINGRPVTLQDLKSLGEMLIDIHSQHAHQSLLKKDQQRRLLDEFAGLGDNTTKLKAIAKQFQQAQQRLTTLESNRSEQSARAQLLGYQVDELDKLELIDGELENLEQEQKQLANGEQIQQACQHTIALCSEGELNVVSILNQALRSLGEIPVKSQSLDEASQLLSSALIQAEEANSELQHHLDSFELDPERLHAVENRLSTIYDIARKHHIQPAQLPELHQGLQAELTSIAGSDEEIEQLQQQLTETEQQYQALATKISKKRKTAAKKLQKQVEAQLEQLAMANCSFSIDLAPRADNSPHANGNEDIAFLVSTNPGQQPAALSKIASGGELSRISLAIQVITAKTSAIPTLVFDEVDVGIGGAVAEVVGNLLQELGERGQVLCVTHQPQVASKGHQHLYASKTASKKSVSTQLEELSDKKKIEEIARMLGGIAITDQSLAHAKEMLSH